MADCQWLWTVLALLRKTKSGPPAPGRQWSVPSDKANPPLPRCPENTAYFVCADRLLPCNTLLDRLVCATGPLIACTACTVRSCSPANLRNMQTHANTQTCKVRPFAVCRSPALSPPRFPSAMRLLPTQDERQRVLTSNQSLSEQGAAEILRSSNDSFASCSLSAHAPSCLPLPHSVPDQCV